MKAKALLRKFYKRYLLDAMSAMALGLFSSLIIGLIISQLSKISFLNFLAPFGAVVSASSPVVGAAIGVAIDYGLKTAQLVMFSSAATGALGYNLGGPIGAYLAAVVGAELGGLVAGKTKVDIIVVPVVTIVTGCLVITWTAPGINWLVAALQSFLEKATMLQPIPMGIIISVIFGMVLTAPISSAALAAMIFTVPEGEVMGQGLMLAAGAATVGCCAQMVGFAVQSYRENGFSGLIAQGIGTSMLQFGNILRKPIIWLPTIITSAILGPLSTTVFKMLNASSSAGMGTSGLVGQFGTWAVMADQGAASVIIRMLLIQIILPALLTWLISEFMRKKGWIKPEDQKLEL